MKQYEKSITSQWGEDGVIEEIFNRIGTKNKIAVDIGAWDGKHFSNTWSLAKHGWTRYLFEKDETKMDRINCFPSDWFIVTEVSNIDNELGKCSVPTDFDLLCIDIDGDDYYLFQDMVKYKPRVVCIEYNQTVPPHISIVQERGGAFGASWLAIFRLAIKKGYDLWHTTVTNMIFVDNNVQRAEHGPDSMPIDWVSYIVTGYNGKQYRIGDQAHTDNQGGKHERLITDVKYTEI